MKAIKIISIMNHGGEYAISVTYNQADENGKIIRKNAKSPTFYAVGDLLENIKAIESMITGKLEDN
ncbi:hypothetical protein [Parablautia sp. Marseille-Q6255]|uniref:hypothetical protein n=1 Tax=Parablautia sp. Marseille-Q6255 TaxID=3039593 RepID=UPI0024BC3E01|nr:hypothetical protein [Parablautia sp. Marseille-Q6255]